MDITNFIGLLILDRHLAISVGSWTFQRFLPGGGHATCPPKEAIADFLARNPGITPPQDITTLLTVVD